MQAPSLQTREQSKSPGHDDLLKVQNQAELECKLIFAVHCILRAGHCFFAAAKRSKRQRMLDAFRMRIPFIN